MLLITIVAVLRVRFLKLVYFPLFFQQADANARYAYNEGPITVRHASLLFVFYVTWNLTNVTPLCL